MSDLRGTRCIVAGLFSAKDDVERLVAALRQSLEQQGATVVDVVVQRRGVSRSKRPRGVDQLNVPLNSATVIGSGKVEVLRGRVAATGANLVVFCNSLTSAQLVRLEASVGCRVIVRVRAD